MLNFVVLAAGMGSRYGGNGLKQVAPVDADGYFIIDYSIYDALRAGIETVVFVIKKEMERDFRDSIGRRIEKHANVSYVFQDIGDLPPGFTLPIGRVKPWGTAHAVLSARRAVNGPFITANADDFYGREAIAGIVGAISSIPEETCVMAGYELGNTLPETGGVSRGICRVDTEGFLISVDEHFNVMQAGDLAVGKNNTGKECFIPLDALTSLNLWGFKADIFKDFAYCFEEFLNKTPLEQLAEAEFFLPDFVRRQIKEGRLQARVLRTKSKWHGVTYKNDLKALVCAIAEYKKQGVYPERLWQN